MIIYFYKCIFFFIEHCLISSVNYCALNKSTKQIFERTAAKSFMLHPNLLWRTLHDHILLCFAIWTGYQLPWGRCSALKIIDAYLACDSRQPGHNQEEQSRQMPGMPFSCKNLSRVVAKVFVIKYFLPSSVSFPPLCLSAWHYLILFTPLNTLACALGCKPLWQRSTFF